MVIFKVINVYMFVGYTYDDTGAQYIENGTQIVTILHIHKDPTCVQATKLSH